MKQKSTNKRLSLTKETVARLNAIRMDEVRGGVAPTGFSCFCTLTCLTWYPIGEDICICMPNPQ